MQCGSEQEGGAGLHEEEHHHHHDGEKHDDVKTRMEGGWRGQAGRQDLCNLAVTDAGPLDVEGRAARGVGVVGGGEGGAAVVGVGEEEADGIRARGCWGHGDRGLGWRVEGLEAADTRARHAAEEVGVDGSDLLLGAGPGAGLFAQEQRRPPDEAHRWEPRELEQGCGLVVGVEGVAARDRVHRRALLLRAHLQALARRQRAVARVVVAARAVGDLIAWALEA
eukprot:480228-Rhodomonas_salina.8